MATRKRSELEQERMTDANLSKVIRMLEDPPEGEKAWTKKECCQYLGMTYNTTRLGALIEEYKQKQARITERKAALRGKPASAEDVAYIIGEYLRGETVDGISRNTYRSPAFIKNILNKNAVPIRTPGHTYFNSQIIPDEATRSRFQVGEVVYSARYDSLARIDAETKTEKYGYIYRIWLLSEKWLQYGNQEAYELASLQHLREIGVQI